ncbi:MAG: glycine zipper domain-containing protein [Azonexus sp.]|nr:glycine zipper domain-containing protein [Azonexus sp.]
MSISSLKRPVAAAVAGIFLLSACATNPDGSYKMDDRATGALIGAAAGCAVGAAAKGAQGCAVGAAVGAAAGFLIGWYFESKKVADAKQVNNEYEQQSKLKGKAKGEPVPKNEVVPAKFESKVTTAAPDQSGQKEIQVTSNTDLVGYGDKVPELQQKYAIYDEKNNLVEEKTEKLAAVDGAGRYETSSKFKLPAEAKGKKYTVKTTLVSNNKTYKENTYKVTELDGQRLILAAL